MHLVVLAHGPQPSNHAAHIEGVADHARVEHGLNVEHLFLLVSHLLSQIPNHLLFLDDVALLDLVLRLQPLFDLAHHLTLLECPLLLDVQLSSQLNYLVLLYHSLVVEHLPELLLVSL